MDGVVALQDADPRVLEHGDHLVAAVRMEVVVAENGIDRDLELPARVGQHRRLLGLAVCRQVTGEEDHVRLARDGGERMRHPLP